VAALGAGAVPGAGQVGEADRLGDDHPAQLDEVRLRDVGGVVAGECA
jgi:hypothetical protein